MYLYNKAAFDLVRDAQNGDKASIRHIIDFGEKYCLSGNLIQHYIAYLIMMDENPFSLSLERKEGVGTAEEFAKADIKKIRDIWTAKTACETSLVIEEYTPIGRVTGNEDIRRAKLISSFSKKLAAALNLDTFYNTVKAFYRDNGVGFFGLNKAFYMKDDGEIVPVSHIKEFDFDGIRGYEPQKQKLIANTEAFVSGGIGNNVLLYGDSGTGKSTSIKAVLNMFFEKGLRMIQVQKHQFVHLGELTDLLKTRNYKFILYMDDLSFEDFEVEYKYLKAAIEGGLQEKPENVLIYATSNRRHIIKETFTDREGGDDVHRNESIQEKISLSERFGMMIYYPKPTQSEFFDMALFLAEREGITLPDEEIIAEARKWGVSHGGLSGRAAEQFITYLKSQK